MIRDVQRTRRPDGPPPEQAKDLQEEIQKFQASVAQIIAEASQRGWLRYRQVNGRLEALNVRISEEAMQLNDREMLEDLIVAATNQALAKVRQQLSEEARRWPRTLGLRRNARRLPRD